MKNVIALIPARLNSKRLNKKALLPLKNIPLIIHVYKRVLKAKKIDEWNIDNIYITFLYITVRCIFTSINKY